MADAVTVSETILTTAGDIALQAGEAALIAQYPILGLPVIKQIWEFFASELEARVIAELEKSANVLIIQVSEQNNAVQAKNAATNLQTVQNDPKATEADKQKAIEDFKNAYANLIGFTIDPTP